LLFTQSRDQSAGPGMTAHYTVGIHLNCSPLPVVVHRRHCRWKTKRRAAEVRQSRPSHSSLFTHAIRLTSCRATIDTRDSRRMGCARKVQGSMESCPRRRFKAARAEQETRGRGELAALNTKKLGTGVFLYLRNSSRGRVSLFDMCVPRFQIPVGLLHVTIEPRTWFGAFRQARSLKISYQFKGFQALDVCFLSQYYNKPSVLSRE
jgi:hypothetical protein